MDSTKKEEFRKELESLVNRFSVDSYTGLPDHTLSRFLVYEIDRLRIAFALGGARNEISQP